MLRRWLHPLALVVGSFALAALGLSAQIPQALPEPAGHENAPSTVSVSDPPTIAEAIEKLDEGSVTSGSGIQVQTDTLQYYEDHGLVTGITSPIPK